MNNHPAVKKPGKFKIPTGNIFWHVHSHVQYSVVSIATVTEALIDPHKINSYTTRVAIARYRLKVLAILDNLTAAGGLPAG